MPTKTQKIFVFGAITLFAILFLVDRYYWAQVAQWREDQATNLWLGYTRGITEIPVGLISSRKIPNPNGMPLLGATLSALPNLLTISFFLGIVQILFVTIVGWKAFGGHWQYLALATLPSLSSVILRSISVEFWNQYTITLLNILFLFWAVRYLENGSLWNLPPLAVLMLFAPAMYLAGIVNAIVMALLTVGMMIYKRPSFNGAWIVSAVIMLLFTVSVLLTWRPYFENVGVGQILKFSQVEPDPPGSVPFAFKHADPRILSAPAETLLKAVNGIYVLQIVFALAAFFYSYRNDLFIRFSTKNSFMSANLPVVRIVILCGLFIVLSYALASRLGGADWLGNQRPDQTVQFLPLFLFFIFLLPFSFVRKGEQRIVYGLSNLILMAFVTVNLVCGFFILRDHLQYRGDVLTEADVPLINKIQAVDFIAQDWKKQSDSSLVAVDYKLGGEKWDWVPEFGEKLAKWYPAPMTQGRSFDYELLRRYGLSNQQEGMQLRTFGAARYLVTYAFEDAPTFEQSKITHHIFGRLRVSIVEQ